MSLQFSADRTLPFEVLPQVETRLVGRPQTGQIRLPVVQGLRLAERQAVRKGDESDVIFKSTAELALKIAGEQSDMEAGEALAMLSRIVAEGIGAKVVMEAREGEIKMRYSQEVSDLIEWNMRNDESRAIRAATALIASRVEGQRDWTEDDTTRLHEDLIRDLYAFYLGEELKLNEPYDEEKAMAQMNEALGKLRPVRGNHPPNPTGAATSGSANEPIQEISVSPPSVSPSSRSRSSLRRSKTPSA